MKKSIINKILMVLTVVAVIGFGAYAFAGWGMGYGHHGWGSHAPGWHHGGWDDAGYGNLGSDLSDAEVEKLDKARSDFLEATETLRQNLYAKELDLRSELAKEDPDAKNAAQLQKEISMIEEQLDQKRLEHIIQTRKIHPDAGRGYGPRWGRGSGGGYCWR